MKYLKDPEKINWPYAVATSVAWHRPEKEEFFHWLWVNIGEPYLDWKSYPIAEDGISQHFFVGVKLKNERDAAFVSLKWS
jgi:hypothetical protein